MMFRPYRWWDNPAGAEEPSSSLAEKIPVASTDIVTKEKPKLKILEKTPSIKVKERVLASIPSAEISTYITPSFLTSLKTPLVGSITRIYSLAVTGQCNIYSSSEIEATVDYSNELLEDLANAVRDLPDSYKWHILN